MSLLAIQSLGRNRDTPRFWLESERLHRLGFPHGTPLEIKARPDSLRLRPAILAENHVSSRVTADGRRRPIIDLASHALLDGLSAYSEVKILASFERITVAPSHRAFAIARSRVLRPPFRVVDVFAGGGTLTAALQGDNRFEVVAGIEREPDFADEWQARHVETLLVQCDVRALRPSDLPELTCSSEASLAPAIRRWAGPNWVSHNARSSGRRATSFYHF